MYHRKQEFSLVVKNKVHSNSLFYVFLMEPSLQFIQQIAFYIIISSEMDQTLKQFMETSLMQQKGLINETNKERFQPQLLSEVFKVMQINFRKKIDTSTKELISIVSLKISKIWGKKQQYIYDALTSTKKLERSRLLVKFLFPNFNCRNYIQRIRQRILINLRNQIISEPYQYEILREVSWILNYGENCMPIINTQQQLIRYSPQLKSQLISLKKMLGNQCEFEHDDKKNKKKAYNHNIEVRQIIQICYDQSTDQKFQQQIGNLLKLPKNKTWFGRKLYRLLVAQNWQLDEMHILSSMLKQLCKRKQIKGINLSKIKTSLRHITIQIDRYMNKNKLKQLDEQQKIKQQGKQPLTLQILESSLNPKTQLSKNISLFDCLLLEQQSKSDIII